MPRVDTTTLIVVRSGHMSFIRQYWKTAAVGAIGAGLVYLAMHVYVDHNNLHTLVTAVQQAQAQRATAPKLPVPTPDAK